MGVIMNTKGIRISDEFDVLNISLSEILEEVIDGKSFYWTILFLDGTPNNDQKDLLKMCKKINQSENGLIVTWENLLTISNRFYQMFETIILGCKNPDLLRRYNSEEEMYKTCDITIELIDRAFWEVYSRDKLLMDRIKKKFTETTILYIPYTSG